MDTTTLSRMYAQIVNGKVAKEDSPFVTDDESRSLWDQIAAEVEQARQDNPDVVFAIPNEMPDPDDEADAPDGPPAPSDAPDPEAETPAEDAPETPGSEGTPADSPEATPEGNAS